MERVELVRLVKELREKTGSNVIYCKQALIETDYSIYKAELWLRDRAFGTKSLDRFIQLEKEEHKIGRV